MSNKFFLLYFLVLFILVFFITIFYSGFSESVLSNEVYAISSTNNYIWPVPGYMTITSNYGERSAPTVRSF